MKTHSNLGSHDRPDITKHDFIQGHNANKAEFTRDDMIQAIKFGAAYIDCNILHSVEELESEAISYIDSLRPLSLPKSITLNDDNEIISVEWV